MEDCIRPVNLSTLVGIRPSQFDRVLTPARTNWSAQNTAPQATVVNTRETVLKLDDTSSASSITRVATELGPDRRRRSIDGRRGWCRGAVNRGMRRDARDGVELDTSARPEDEGSDMVH